MDGGIDGPRQVGGQAAPVMRRLRWPIRMLSTSPRRMSTSSVLRAMPSTRAASGTVIRAGSGATGWVLMARRPSRQCDDYWSFR